MEETYYLLWDSNAWGVYSKGTCPDSGAFSDFWYRKYQVDEERASELFKKLMDIKERLVSEDIIPSRENYDETFPELEEVLK